MNPLYSNRIRDLTVALLAALVLFSLSTQGKTLSADEVWESAKIRSPEIASEETALESAIYSAKSAKLHWSPRVSLLGQAWTSNDPAQNFFGNLGQRQITSQDFNPSTLNQPGYHSFQSLGLNVYLPLFEGGRKSALADIAEQQVLVQNLTKTLATLKLKSIIYVSYGKILSAAQSLEKLHDLERILKNLVGRYSIGSAANPVGYSGLLGLKGILNRLHAEQIALSAERKNQEAILRTYTGLEEEIIAPKSQNYLGYLREFVDPIVNISLSSVEQQMIRIQEEITSQQKNSARSLYFPQIGLFGNTGLVQGSRNTGYASTAGVMLSWSLFDQDTLYRLDIAEKNRQTAAKKIESKIMQESIQKSQLDTQVKSLQEMIETLSESTKILEEQTKTASRLFQSGSLSALQLSEVYNRRIDLILNLARVETQLLDAKGNQVTLSSYSH